MRYLLASKTGSVVTVARAQGTCKELPLGFFLCLNILTSSCSYMALFSTPMQRNPFTECFESDSQSWISLAWMGSCVCRWISLGGGGGGCVGWVGGGQSTLLAKRTFPRGKLRLSCQWGAKAYGCWTNRNSPRLLQYNLSNDVTALRLLSSSVKFLLHSCFEDCK